jgi:nucleoside-diphosphate-sugar epimerase
MAEVIAITLAAQKHIPFTVTRLWNVYGPGQRIATDEFRWISCSS